MHDIFLTGATGYIGRHLVPELLARGHTVRVLVRPGSESKLAKGAIAIGGNALDRATFESHVAPSDTLHLVNAGGDMLLRLYRHPQPTVIAVTGHALAAGALLVLACDSRIGTPGPAPLPAQGGGTWVSQDFSWMLGIMPPKGK